MLRLKGERMETTDNCHAPWAVTPVEYVEVNRGR